MISVYVDFDPNDPNRFDGSRYAHGWKARYSLQTFEVSYFLPICPICPGVFRRGHRHENNFDHAEWIGLDFDEGMTLDEACRDFQPYVHVIGTTKSHQAQKGTKPPCDRFRVMLKIGRPVNLDEYRRIARDLMGKYPQADRACKDGARFFFPCVEIVSEGHNGKVLTVPKPEPELPKVKREARVGKPCPGFIAQEIYSEVPEGQKNNTCFRFAAWLIENRDWTEEEVFRLLWNSNLPLTRDEAVEKEMRTTIGNAARKVASR